MPASSATIALLVTLAAAAAARLARAVDTGGAVAGVLVGGAVSVGLGLPGLAALGTFFVVGSGATRIGWARKRAAGTAERGEGARGARRVLAKGGVAAVAALVPHPLAGAAAAGALAAALADTLGTELGVLARGAPRLLPTFRAVAPGTAGAVSLAGTAAGAGGAALVAVAAAAAGLTGWPPAPWVALGGLVGALLESLAAGAAPAFARAPGTLRNVLTTATGALVAALLVGTARGAA